MSSSSPKLDTPHDHQPTIVAASVPIRQRVEDRHWQLFETRLKKPRPDINKENYTNANDYRVINRLKPVDRPQAPIEPNRRWESFCTQLTGRSNETDRVMSIFHNVWQTNWKTKQIPLGGEQQRRMTDPTSNDNAFLSTLTANEHDQKVISTILHRTTSSDNVPTEQGKTAAL